MISSTLVLLPVGQTANCTKIANKQLAFSDQPFIDEALYAGVRWQARPPGYVTSTMVSNPIPCIPRYNI